MRLLLFCLLKACFQPRSQIFYLVEGFCLLGRLGCGLAFLEDCCRFLRILCRDACGGRSARGLCRC